MTTQWSIAQLERTTATGGVTIAHWRATATDGEYSASSYGTCFFTPDADSEGFVAFEALTEADVLEWVYEALDKDSCRSINGNSDRGSEGSCDYGGFTMELIMGHLFTLYVVATSLVTIASVIANYTDTPKDDVWVAKAYKVLEMFAFLNNKAKQV
jgi:hypothetical protein